MIVMWLINKSSVKSLYQCLINANASTTSLVKWQRWQKEIKGSSADIRGAALAYLYEHGFSPLIYAVAAGSVAKWKWVCVEALCC